MDKVHERWYSQHLQREVSAVRWGHWGQPVLLFPTAGGDAEEVERFHLVRAVAPLIEAGRIKLYSCDSVNGRTWVDGRSSGRHRGWVNNQFHAYLKHELIPAIEADCRSPGIEIIATGASIGAFNAMAALCRFPEHFKSAICMSGTFDLSGWAEGEHGLDLHYSSPVHFLPGLAEGPQLASLRQRFALMVVGQGRWETPGHSWRMAALLGAKGVPNRVDQWGPEWDHDWPSWRVMLPHYLSQMA